MFSHFVSVGLFVSSATRESPRRDRQTQMLEQREPRSCTIQRLAERLLGAVRFA